MKFIKYQGLGNDFIIVDSFGEKPTISADRAAKLCDRHFGVGADGILIVQKGVKHKYYMKIINSDGSEPEMCGNGIRCLVKYLVDYRGEIGNPMNVETPGGMKSCRYVADAKTGKATEVVVSMGKPALERRKIPMSGAGSNLNQIVKVRDREFTGHGVSMGNPHFVIFGDYGLGTAASYGGDISEHELFPQKTNVEFVKVVSRNRLEAAVYERGCGVTLACGTGASAIAVASCVLV
ncbi:MAG: diaminopimelate epimerase, partial [Deltaproteobacteria bacterium]|nr:diaminopimelate epimerase [Deltaproteobacteria bacterium]